MLQWYKFGDDWLSGCGVVCGGVHRRRNLILLFVRIFGVCQPKFYRAPSSINEKKRSLGSSCASASLAYSFKLHVRRTRVRLCTCSFLEPVIDECELGTVEIRTIFSLNDNHNHYKRVFIIFHLAISPYCFTKRNMVANSTYQNIAFPEPFNT